MISRIVHDGRCLAESIARTRTLRVRRRYVMASATSLLAILVACGSDPPDSLVGATTSAISQECGRAPTVGPCETVTCDTSTGIWETGNKPAGVLCLGTGHCDDNGNCIPPPPPPPPGCDNPPRPRYYPGDNGNYPNGADVLACTRPAPGVEAWHIDYPSVDQLTTNYPTIAFNAGDSITLSASGCAQRGGGGNTWARYLEPEPYYQPSSDAPYVPTKTGRYYGTLQISGVTGAATISQPIQHWAGPAFVTPNAGSLVLGYVDYDSVTPTSGGPPFSVDGHGDNGYWGHDPGDNNQCINDFKATVDVVINHNRPNGLTCSQWKANGLTPVAPDVPELAQIASMLRTQADVPLGLPVTGDASSTGISHFQIFQDGAPGSASTISNRPLNSAESHSDGCMYVAYTPVSAPAWYPTDIAFDKDPNRGWLVRPWDPRYSAGTFSNLQANNRDPNDWLPTFAPGTCTGAGSSWRWSAPRWMMICNLQNKPPSQWTAQNLFGFPGADGESSKISHSGAVCDWHIKQSPSFNPCVDSGRAEWTGVYGGNVVFATAQGTITNSFLSGGDYGGDHNNIPGGRFLGDHTDLLTHTTFVDDSCQTLAGVTHGEPCADWELNLVPDPNYRHMLAADESQANDGLGGNCIADYGDKYRHGNQADDLRGALGIEGEQWYYPLGFRPEPGDRAVVRGSYIIDCGHADWHSELHPASLMESSFLQVSDYSPVAGATWNRPQRLTDHWRAITGGVPAVVTKLILSPVFAENVIDAEIWPPARPCAGAHFRYAREYETPNAAWSGVTILSEESLPAENPNHLRVTFERNTPYNLEFGDDGDVTNPDGNLTFFQGYMAWWDTNGVACPSPGGPGGCGLGTVQCGGSCSFPIPAILPDPCGPCGTTLCNGTCSAPTPANYGAGCGSCGGTIRCDGSCSVPTPANYGAGCGSCGGYVQCDSTCSASTPSNLGSTCNQCGGHIQCNGSCSPPLPYNYGARCSGTGFIDCSGHCLSGTP